MTAETTAAALTPLAPAGLALVQLAGPDTPAILRQIIRYGHPERVDPSDASRLYFGQIVDGEQVLDDAIVALCFDDERGAHAEISVHGGPRIVQRLLMLLERCGAELVAGEAAIVRAWTASAVVDGEILTLLPRAQTRRAAAWLVRQQRLWPAVLEALRPLFAEQPDAAAAQLRALLARRDAARCMLEGIALAIVGPPNAGKSTLANRLCQQERVLVSDQPGTTRDYVTHPAALAGVPITVIDTAGLRESSDPIEAEAIRRAVEPIARADVRIVLLDAAAAMPPAALSFLEHHATDSRTICVLNKVDLPARIGPDDLPEPWRDGCVCLSATTGQGADHLAAAVLDAVGIDDVFDTEPAPFTVRQIALLEQALSETPRSPAVAAGLVGKVLGPREKSAPQG